MIKLTLRKKIFHTIGFIVWVFVGLVGLLSGIGNQPPVVLPGVFVLVFSAVRYIDLLKYGEDDPLFG